AAPPGPGAPGGGRPRPAAAAGSPPQPLGQPAVLALLGLVDPAEQPAALGEEPEAGLAGGRSARCLSGHCRPAPHFDQGRQQTTNTKRTRPRRSPRIAALAR